MNKSIIAREGWHTTRDGFRYYVENGRIVRGIGVSYDGSEHTLYPYREIRGKGGRIIGYDSVEPLARYYNITRYTWR